MKKIIFHLLVAIISLSYGCTSETIEYRVEPSLKQHVDQFFIEAWNRGINIQKENLIVVLDNSNKIVDPFYPGLFRKHGEQRIIFIDEYTFNIQKQDENEVLLFHELSHALLHQSHRDEINSIMNTSPNLIMYINNNIKRNDMLNELFYY